MIVRISKVLTVSFIVVLSLLLAVPSIARAGSASGICFGSSSVAQVGCGDGLCDAYVGENKTTCPADCGSNPVIQPPVVATATPTPTFTPSPTATLPFFIGFPTRTSSPTATQTGTPGGATQQATEEPTGGEVTTPESGNGQQGCGYVSFESRTSDWQSGYAGFAKQFVPVDESNREVFVCTVPPFGQVCLPVTPGLLDSGNTTIDDIVVVDCTSSGDCKTQNTKLKRVGNMLCSDVVVSGSLSCTGGCALAPQGSSSLLDLRLGGLLSGIPTAAVAPIACFLLFVLLAGVGLLIFVSRRSKRKELKRERAAAAASD